MQDLPAALRLRHGLAVFAVLLMALAATTTQAATIQFDLRGTAGAGLLPGNETPAVTGGTGGEIGAGIVYDDVTRQLTLNVGWGSSQGFTDLSSTANNSHIHGPTVNNFGNDGTGSFRQTAGVAFSLVRSADGVTGGFFMPNTITLTAEQETNLFNGKYYINLHTANNGGGEMRGFLVPVTPVLAIDFNDRSFGLATNTPNGFDSFFIGAVGSSTLIQTAATVRAFGPYTVTVSGSGSNPGYDDRLRTTPANSPALTQAPLYRDFVFSPDTGSGGLNVTVAGLVPNQAYRVTGWSFDQGTAGGRLSDWSANGTLMVGNYFFNGATLPTSDNEYTFTFKVSASPSGQIALQGRRDSSSPAGIAVFLNALHIEVTAPDAPVIVAPPAPVELYVGDNAAFAATLGGTAPFAYQWWKDASPIPDATNATLRLTNCQPADAAAYTVVVTNPSGSVTSAPAALVVQAVTGYSSGLLAYWPLNSLGPDAYDISGSNQTLYATNLDNGNIVSGQRGNALSFNGQDEFLTRTNGPGDALPAYSYPAYTVAMWVKGWYTNQLDRRVWCESANTNNNPLMTLGTDAAGTNGNLDVFVRNNNAVTPHNHRKSTSTNVFDGNWHHIAWVDNNGAARLYVDGVLDATDFSYVRGVLTPNLATLGAVYRTTNIAHFNGALDDAAVWRRALSQAEIQHFMVYGESTFTDVTTTNDSGPGSLRAALTAAYPGDTINFASLLATQTISLASEIVVNVPAPGVTVVGLSSEDRITIDDGTNTNHRLFNVTGGQATFSNFILANGGGTSFADVGGAFRNAGTLSLEDCVLTGHRSAVDGGAIHNDGGTLTILNSTLSGNASGAGGGAIHGGTMTLTNCTLAGNTAVNGGAIRGAGSMTLTHCTIAGNTASGVGGGVDNLSSIELNFSIVAGNSPDNLTGSFTGLQNLTSGDPILAPLGDFGGPTLTMPSMPGSPARNAATNSTTAKDQRNSDRDSLPDIGAYEAGATVGRGIPFHVFIWESLPTTNVAAHDPAVDYDGDGASNNDEWRAATDPGNADSVFRILSITPDNGTNYLIRIPTARPPGNTDTLAYVLYYSDVLPAIWTNDPMGITGDGTIQTFTNTRPPEATNRFYRVLVQPGRSR